MKSVASFPHLFLTSDQIGIMGDAIAAILIPQLCLNSHRSKAVDPFLPLRASTLSHHQGIEVLLECETLESNQIQICKMRTA